MKPSARCSPGCLCRHETANDRKQERYLILPVFIDQASLIPDSSRSTGRRSPGKARRRRITLLVLLLFAIPALTAFWAFSIEPALLTVTRYTSRHAQLPEQWHGRTIAFFSDTHLGPDYLPEKLGRVAEAIEREKPDLILFGGDLIDHRTPQDPGFAADVIEVLSRMRAPLGQYAIAGNHDNRLIAEYRYMADLLADSGFTLLDNQSAVLDGIWLGGLAESYFGRPDLDQAFSAAGLISPEMEDDINNDQLFRLLLMHQPDYAAALPADGFNLAFSGHSHNGQVTFFGRPIITVHEGRLYPHGLYHLDDNRSLLVSRGLGTVGIAARLGAPPQLVLLTLLRD